LPLLAMLSRQPQRRRLRRVPRELDVPTKPAQPSSRPLLTFWLGIFGLLAVAWFGRQSLTTWPAIARQLADGDCDQAERVPLLERLVELGRVPDDDGGLWASRLAAIALADRAAYANATQYLGGEPGRAPGSTRWLDLGDPMLGNVLLAAVAESAARTDDARRIWRQVAAQARLTARPFAGELAAAALARLR
jgi:hypothetical protein